MILIPRKLSRLGYVKVLGINNRGHGIILR
jgi:hypothetical protein